MVIIFLLARLAVALYIVLFFASVLRSLFLLTIKPKQYKNHFKSILVGLFWPAMVLSTEGRKEVTKTFKGK